LWKYHSYALTLNVWKSLKIEICSSSHWWSFWSRLRSPWIRANNVLLFMISPPKIRYTVRELKKTFCYFFLLFSIYPSPLVNVLVNWQWARSDIYRSKFFEWVKFYETLRSIFTPRFLNRSVGTKKWVVKFTFGSPKHEFKYYMGCNIQIFENNWSTSSWPELLFSAYTFLG